MKPRNRLASPLRNASKPPAVPRPLQSLTPSPGAKSAKSQRQTPQLADRRHNTLTPMCVVGRLASRTSRPPCRERSQTLTRLSLRRSFDRQLQPSRSRQRKQAPIRLRIATMQLHLHPLASPNTSLHQRQGPRRPTRSSTPQPTSPLPRPLPFRSPSRQGVRKAIAPTTPPVSARSTEVLSSRRRVPSSVADLPVSSSPLGTGLRSSLRPPCVGALRAATGLRLGRWRGVQPRPVSVGSRIGPPSCSCTAYLSSRSFGGRRHPLSIGFTLLAGIA